MLGVTDFGAFVVTVIIFLLIPGPGNLALITSTSKGGIRGGIAATLGVILGDQVLMWLAVAGVAASYYMINCAHPDHFGGTLQDAPWARRIRGLRANASRKSHAELDAATELDAGSPHELGQQYSALADRMPWLNVFGGCCGSDLRHVTEIARALQHRARA